MSAEAHITHDHDHAHAHDHGAPGHHGVGHGSLKDYVTGFVLSVILTAIPFWLVMDHVIADSRIMALLIIGIAVIQIIVHMVYFLHMSSRSEGGWSMLAMIFTIVLVVITLSGSIWIMDNLNGNMMPMSPHAMRSMP
jgi:cytochrome o ubiquinol oxidase operon protein cyoD